jgi:SAM-dependent methyltransferase
MKIGLIPETMLERIGLLTGQVPVPIGHVLGGMVMARALIAATQLGIFEALRGGRLPAPAVAAACGSDPYATQKLLDALVSSGYLIFRSSAYGLTPTSRKWLLKDSPTSLYDVILFESLEWSWLARMDEFIQSGRPLDFHTTMTSAEWRLYQRGMRALAGISAGEVSRRMPLPRRARAMLDIGGSHGYYAVAICRRRRGLRATILDLPQAIEHAAPLLARERMGDRVVHRAGDALTDDLGTAAYDLVLISQLVHHFDDATNRELVRRAARALRPGGYLVIMEAIRRASPSAGGMVAGLLDLYFAFTSRAGAWSFDEMASWQRDAGLLPQAPIRFLKRAAYRLQAGIKPAAEDQAAAIMV